MQFQEKLKIAKKAVAYNEDDGDRGWDGRGNSGMTSHKLNYSTRNNNRRQCPVIDYYCIYIQRSQTNSKNICGGSCEKQGKIVIFVSRR